MVPLGTQGTPLEGGLYGFSAGLGAAVVPIALAPGTGSGIYIKTVAAYCSAPGASITIAGYPAIPVPPGGSVTVAIDCALGTGGPPTSVTFVGTDGYFVDWIGLPP